MSDELQNDISGREADNTDTPPSGSNGKKWKAIAIICILGIVFAAISLRWWIRHQTHIETDNAYIEARIHPIASRVQGRVVRLLVQDNQPVQKGTLLVEIDPADYRAELEKAAADVQVARNESGGESSQVAVAQAAVRRAEAQAEQARSDLKRGKVLFERDVIPKEQLERMETADRVTSAQLAEASESLRKARIIAGHAGGDESAKIRFKQASLSEAQLKLSYTRIYAPTDGFITRKSVEQGNIVQIGQPLMSVVPLTDAWVTANYKESQLTHIRHGQKVTFKVDAYPEKLFIGRVESIMAGTGAAFSLLPPENATGNYVKVVQRIPVKIAIDPLSDPEHLLRVGMSVTPAVLVERKTSDILRELIPLL